MRKKGFMKTLAVALCFIMGVSITPVAKKAEAKATLKAADQSFTPAPTWEGMLELIKANRLENIDMETYGDFSVIHEVRNTDSADLLTIEAQNLKANADNVAMEYQLYDINRDKTPELIMLSAASGARSGVNIYRHDTYHFQVDHVKTIGGVTSMYKKPKKKQIIFVTSSSAYRLDVITYKMTNKGKLKKVVTYSQNGKSFKKDKKKISKSAFVKYFKSLDKLKKIKTKKIPKKNIPLTFQVESTYYNKDVYYYNVYMDDCSDALVMSKANRTESPAQDKFLAFRMTYDRLENDEYAADPALARYVFGPDVTDPKTGKTFQEEDWEEVRLEVFGNGYGCPFFHTTENEAGEKVLAIEEEGSPKVTTGEGKAKNGSDTYKTMDYSFEYGDSVVVISFYSEGPLAGRAAKAVLKYPNITGETPFDTYTFTYGVENTGYPEWDPLIGVQVRGEGVSAGMPDAKNRTLTIDSTTPAYKQTVVVNENVEFILFVGKTGQFYSYKEDGTTRWDYPSSMGQDEENYVAFQKILNPETGQLTYGDPKLEKGLFWEPKAQ